MEKLQSESASIAERTSQLNLDILAADKDIENAKAGLERLQESSALSADHDEKWRADIDRYNGEIEEAQADIVSLNEQLASLKTAGENANVKIEDLTKERDEAEAQSSRLRAAERDKSSERERISGELARLEERKAGMRRDYDATVNKLYDEYQLTPREAANVTSPSENAQESEKSLREVKADIKALGSVNVGAIEEYKEVSARYEFMKGQIDDVETS